MAKEKLIKFNGGKFRSWDECYFSSWLSELAKEGLIREAEYEPYPFVLTEGLVNKYTVEQVLKTKTKYIDKEQAILRPSTYTPDFLIFWSDKAKGKLFQVLNEGKEITSPFIAHCEDEGNYSLVEIKPSFSLHNSTRIFINNQKDVWERYEKFVNLIKIEELFAETFTPKSFLKTATGKKRKPKWRVRTLQQFIK